MIHAVYDVTDCDAGVNPDRLVAAMRATAGLLGATVLGELVERFQPHGATCVLVLAESHMTVSTWPECRLAHIDVFTCRADVDPDTAVTPILDAIRALRTAVTSQRIERTLPAAIGTRPGSG